jgi:hypothetical protein
MSIQLTSDDLSILAPPDGGPTFLALDEHNVYWTDSLNGRVMRAPLNGGPAVVLVDDPDNTPWGIAVNLGWVYWVDDEGLVLKVPVDGGTPILLCDGGHMPVNVAVDATSVYWTDYGENAVGSVLKLTPK